jgi:putative membrane protein
VGSPSLLSALISLHVLANMVWIGSLLSAAVLLSGTSAAGAGTPPARLGRRIYLRLAMPAFAVSFLCGIGVLGMSLSSYLHAPWMHAKLTLAAAIIAIHHVIGARARRAGEGRTEAARGATGLAIAVFVCSAGVVWLAVTRRLP